MAANPNSNIHNDTWMTDAYNRRGPLGESPVTDSPTPTRRRCAARSPSTRRAGSSPVCPSIPFPPQARIIDPDTLAPIDTLDLPTAPNPPGQNEYQNFAGGGYFFLDQKDRIWVPTRTDHIFVIDEGRTATRSTRQARLRPDRRPRQRRRSGSPPPCRTSTAMSGSSRSRTPRSARSTRRPATTKLIRLDDDEEIENSFSVASDGVYIVSNKRMYRLKAKGSDKPKIVWQAKYPNSGIVKPSQVDAGSGTTPTNLDGGYVAITDNADPMHVVVYRTAKNLKKGQKRAVCKVPGVRPGRQRDRELADGHQAVA